MAICQAVIDKQENIELGLGMGQARAIWTQIDPFWPILPKKMTHQAPPSSHQEKGVQKDDHYDNLHNCGSIRSHCVVVGDCVGREVDWGMVDQSQHQTPISYQMLSIVTCWGLSEKGVWGCANGWRGEKGGKGSYIQRTTFLPAPIPFADPNSIHQAPRTKINKQ